MTSRRCDVRCHQPRDVAVPPARPPEGARPRLPLPLPGAMAVLAANPSNPVVFFDVTIGGQVAPGGGPGAGRGARWGSVGRGGVFRPAAGG